MNYKENFLKSINKIAEKEIDKVNINQNYLEVLESQDKEIERLNNIINKLEKFVNNYIIWGGGKNEGKVFKWTGDGYVEVYDFITDLSKKIQELKGSDKVE